MNWKTGSFSKQTITLNESILVPDWIAPSTSSSSDDPDDPCIPVIGESESQLDLLASPPLAFDSFSDSFRQAFQRSKSLNASISKSSPLPSPKPVTQSSLSSLSPAYQRRSDASVETLVNTDASDDGSDYESSGPTAIEKYGTDSNLNDSTHITADEKKTSSTEPSATSNKWKLYLNSLLSSTSSSKKSKRLSRQLSSVVPPTASVHVEVAQSPPACLTTLENNSHRLSLSAELEYKNPMNQTPLRKMTQLDDCITASFDLSPQAADDNDCNRVQLELPKSDFPSSNTTSKLEKHLSQQIVNTATAAKVAGSSQSYVRPNIARTRSHSATSLFSGRSFSHQPPLDLASQGRSLSRLSVYSVASIGSLSSVGSSGKRLSLAGASTGGDFSPFWLHHDQQYDVKYKLVVRVKMQNGIDQERGSLVRKSRSEGVTVELPVVVC
ncbi:hypothetical protein BDR26DRAFT_864975 [Obelidium mucronatum]|nr:hypothetical protein BDR26DRAFT_864975 [Obelidium mucronatum]